MAQRECDVLIVGAGMAGSTLARQLRRQQPDLKIINIEKRDDFDYHIGESTVEVWVDYAYRVLGLGPYLMKNHIVKHGLRFFFDSKERDLPFHEMSENGRDRYSSVHNSHQLDRQQFDRDMARMNRKDGVEVLMGTAVEGSPQEAVTIDRDGGHTVRTNQGEIRCRWLVDAAGFGSPLARKFDLIEPEDFHASASYWARFKDTRIVDELGPDEWRRKHQYTMRHFSTNHMMYRGCWWWLIPLSEDTISVGVETDKRLEPRKCASGDELVAWMKEHRWGRDLLGDKYELLDFKGFGNTTRRSKQYYSEDRWFLTGMSGLVIDALYSTTGITTAYGNRLIGELIKTDRSGDAARLKRQVHHFNLFMRTRYEYFMRGISNYDRHASFEVFTGMRQAFQSTYHNQRVPEGCMDLHYVIKTADDHAGGCDCSLEKEKKAIENSLVSHIRRLAAELTALLDKLDKYYEHNRGGFAEATERESLLAKYWDSSPELEAKENRITYEASFRHLLESYCHRQGVAWNEPAFDAWFKREWTSGQTLEEGCGVLRTAPPPPADYQQKVFWSAKGPVERDSCLPANVTALSTVHHRGEHRDEVLADWRGPDKQRH